MKCHKRVSLEIVGYLEARGGREIEALILARRGDARELIYVQRLGTELAKRHAPALLERLRAIVRKTTPLAPGQARECTSTRDG